MTKPESQKDRDQNAKLEKAARDAVREGGDVRAKLERATEEALAGDNLAAARVKVLIGAAVSGASEGAKGGGEEGSERLTEALKGIEDALGKLILTSRLAAEEAAAQAGSFADTELSRARDRLRAIERGYWEVLRETARRTDIEVGSILRRFADHLRAGGAEFGKQFADSFSDFGEELRKKFEQQASELERHGQTMASKAADLLDEFAERLRRAGAKEQASETEEAKPPKSDQSS
jgi:ElaB/YqjD/DUF883 family membrane-anchored ribosome-binding protein